MYSFETGHIKNTTVKNVILTDETLFVNLEQSEKEGFLLNNKYCSEKTRCRNN